MYDTPHGLANAVILPYVLELYGSTIHKKLHDISDAAGLSRTSDTDEQASARLIQEIRDLNTSMKIPAHLNEIRKKILEIWHIMPQRKPILCIQYLSFLTPVSSSRYIILSKEK